MRKTWFELEKVIALSDLGAIEEAKVRFANPHIPVNIAIATRKLVICFMSLPFWYDTINKKGIDLLEN